MSAPGLCHTGTALTSLPAGDREQGWEVLIPAVAFKNSTSSFFGSKPFRLVLPGTFFVKPVKRTSADASYNQNTFYEAWRLTIQRYGIYNPYTGRGAIRGRCRMDRTMFETFAVIDPASGRSSWKRPALLARNHVEPSLRPRLHPL